MNWFKEFPQETFLDLIRSGLTEVEALQNINDSRKLKFASPVVVQMQVKLPTFREALEEAKKQRADVWFNGIVGSISQAVEKDQVPAEKLKFEQRKYLAAIDNPEKYSEKVKHQLDVQVNIFQEMKDMSHSDVKKIMSSADPFVDAIDVEYENLNPGPSDLGPEDNEEEDIFS